MIPNSYLQMLWAAMPEVIVIATALTALTIDLAVLRLRSIRLRFSVASSVASFGCIAAIARMVAVHNGASLLDGMLVTNPLTMFMQGSLLALTVITLLLSVESRFTEHVGEYVFLVMLSTSGMMFLVSSQNTLAIFVALELLSLSLYALSAFDKSSFKGSEAAMKYFLFGGMSAAFLLFGISLLYGVSNSTSLIGIAARLAHSGLSPVVAVALVMTVIGLGFKIAAAPFHFWAPDVYQSAPNPVVGLIASASKVASFYIFFLILTVGFVPIAGSAAWRHFVPGWSPVIAAVAALSMVLGNLAAIVQNSVRRLLAYSAIAHAGYMLIAIAAHTQQSFAALIYYVLTYSLATLGTFAVIGIVEKETGGDQLINFNGLSRRAPVLSLSLFVFLLSQVGIPPLAGFFGKFYLFVSALADTSGSNGLLWLVILALAMSAVSLYYYLQVLKRVYVIDADEGAGPLAVPLLPQLVIAVLAAGVVILGCAPNLLLQWTLEAIRVSGF